MEHWKGYTTERYSQESKNRQVLFTVYKNILLLIRGGGIRMPPKSAPIHSQFGFSHPTLDSQMLNIRRHLTTAVSGVITPAGSAQASGHGLESRYQRTPGPYQLGK